MWDVSPPEKWASTSSPLMKTYPDNLCIKKGENQQSTCILDITPKISIVLSTVVFTPIQINKTYFKSMIMCFSCKLWSKKLNINKKSKVKCAWTYPYTPHIHQWVNRNCIAIRKKKTSETEKATQKELQTVVCRFI